VEHDAANIGFGSTWLLQFRDERPVGRPTVARIDDVGELEVAFRRVQRVAVLAGVRVEGVCGCGVPSGEPLL
jgi:hypothetical protein